MESGASGRPPRIAILGAGLSGSAAAELAVSHGCFVEMFDETERAEIPGFTCHFPWSGFPLSGFDLVVVSPGLPPNSKLYRAAVDAGIKLIGELAFGFAFSACPVIAITGTNGKTTTTEMADGLLSALGYRSLAAGNIGLPLSAAVSDSANLDFLVVEVSSFQLELADGFRPVAAALLNLASDHQDRHGSPADYAAAKAAVFQYPDTKAVVNADLRSWWRKNFSDRPAVFFPDESPVLPDFGNPALTAKHNRENALAALALLMVLLGGDILNDPRVNAFLGNFKTGEHRLELFLESGGVKFINDSKATNPHATMAALESVGGDKSIILILGGRDKNMDFAPLRNAWKRVRQAILIGESGEGIARAVGDAFPTVEMKSLESAVEHALLIAESGDTVLLSPACASMDAFADYRQRGARFRELILDMVSA